MANLIELIHLGGERKICEVTGATYLRTALDVYWGPLNGTYVLDLKRNQLLRAAAWRAVDVDEAWRLYHALCGKKFGVVKVGKKVQCLLCGGSGWKDGLPCTLCAVGRKVGGK